jgi:hypothetical protein
VKQLRWLFLIAMSFLIVATIAVAQVKKQNSPFDKYRSSTVNELEFRKLQFQVEAMRLSLQPTPVPSGLGVPHIVGETVEGKLLIEVEVYGSDLPQTVAGRKDAMMESVGRSMAGLSFAFPTSDTGMLADELFNKWCVVQFSDTEKFLNAKSKKPVDPYIGIYENGELVSCPENN